ncbi:MAG: hypothetical protein HUK12_02340, partial [Muribaculaceae bacterium]|nr:hypothetical protein [Muribaculaceae bacterium]
NSKATDPAKMPSFKAMCEWVQTVPEYQDFKARETYNAFNDVILDDEAEASGGTPQEAPQSPHNQPGKPQQAETPQAAQNAENGADFPEWVKGLERDKQGNLKSSAKNIKAIMSNEPFMQGVRYNDFTHRVDVLNALPWDPLSELPRTWSDTDAAGLRQYLEIKHGIAGKDKIKDGFAVFTNTRHYHPIRDYFNGLPAWDNVPRLDRLIIDYLGAEDNELTRTMTRKHLVAAVARVFEPGCKYDYTLILEGAQGKGKSWLITNLGAPWSSETLTTFKGKEAMEEVTKVWLIEIAELAAVLNDTTGDNAKAFLTKQVDEYRPAFKEHSEKFYRQCVFWGTTNKELYLKGDEGQRRFWIIKIKPELRKKDYTEKIWLYENKNQIWAEALHYYRTEARREGLGNYLVLPPELETQARLLQYKANMNDYEEVLRDFEEFVETEIPYNYEALTMEQRIDYYSGRDYRQERTKHRMAFCRLQYIHEWRRIPKNDAKKIAECMSLLKGAKLAKNLPGWSEADGIKKFPPYGKQRYFIRAGDSAKNTSEESEKENYSISENEDL